MEYSLKQLFSIIDGRLSTKIEDVYQILTFYTGNPIYTHELIDVIESIKNNKPDWFINAENKIDEIKLEIGNDFNLLMKEIDENYSNTSFQIRPINS